MSFVRLNRNQSRKRRRSHWFTAKSEMAAGIGRWPKVDEMPLRRCRAKRNHGGLTDHADRNMQDPIAHPENTFVL